MDIDRELCKVFYRIAITLSSSEASRQLFILQSAVSQSIKVLEKELSRPLLIRSTKKVQLTPEGEILLKHIEPAVNLIKRGKNQPLEAHTLNGSRLRIDASDTVCHYYLVPCLNRFHKELPNTHIKVTNQAFIECTCSLESGRADSIVTNYPNPVLIRNMHAWVINGFHDVLMAGRSAFPLEGRRLTLEELLDYPIMVLDRKNTTSESPYQIFQESQLDLVPEIEFSSNDLLIGLARIDLGIAFVPDLCILAQDENPLALNLREQPPSRQMMVTCNGSLSVSQAARQFMGILQ